MRFTVDPVSASKDRLNDSTHRLAGSLTPRPKVVEPPKIMTVTLGGMALLGPAVQAVTGTTPGEAPAEIAFN
jgi:hypothetical protein